MALAKHVSVDTVLAQARDPRNASHHPSSGLTKSEGPSTSGPYSSRYEVEPIPKHHLPSKGVSAKAAYQLVHDELELDGVPNLNLASFVHTWMPEEATKLMIENMGKNLIDSDEYEAVTKIHAKAVNIIANMWHAPHAKEAVGTATTGSSEAIMLGGLAMKRNWEEKMKKAGKDIHNPGPNIVMGANAQVALEKFARYFSVEDRLVPVSKESHYCLDPKKAMQYVDENTIGVFVILGSTYTGHFEPVEEMAKLLDEYQAKTGNDVPIHIDGASGGFVAPFAYPQLKADFRIPRVVSMNTSGHKFGLAYVGVGWVIFRDKAHLPKDMVFELHYLGSVEYSFSLNFSRPAAPIIAQYWSLIHLGFEGYRRIALGDLENARLLSRALEKTGFFTVLSDVHRALESGGSSDATSVDHYVAGLPVVAFRFTDEFKQKYPEIQQKWIQTLLRAKGWIVPNYELPPDEEKTEILRVVVRESFSEDLAALLVEELINIVESLVKSDAPAHALAVLSSDKGKGKRHSGFDKHEKMDVVKPKGAICNHIPFLDGDEMPAVFPIAGAPQLYDWGTIGSASKVAQYAKAIQGFHVDEKKPYAELWMGTHPSLPSKVVKTDQPLTQHVQAHPELLGKSVQQYHGDDLPFLFKVLAIGKALSIQAHPDKTLGKKLHKERPDIYKDPNHKPEMAIALTDFSGFCGFRPLKEIAAFLNSVPEFKATVGEQVADKFIKAVSSSSDEAALERNATPIAEASSNSPSSDLQQALRDLFAALMKADESLFKKNLAHLIARYQKETGVMKAQDAKPNTIEELVLRLNEQFPEDIGCFCSFLLNVVHLKPGEACFLQANEPHAYLSGNIMECMAASDSVVRAGLTPKYRDVETLISMLTYTWGPPHTQLMKPQPFRNASSTTLYDPPIEEFSVLLIDLESSKKEELPALDGPGILIVTSLKGSGTLTFGTESLEITQTGQTFFIGAGVGIKLEGELIAYEAFVEAPK